jgi:predicted site-specific integrase-resolvase
MMDTFLPISDAATRYNLPESSLYQLIQVGTIKSGMLNSGVVIVSEEDIQHNLPKEEREEYKKHLHLLGQTIGVREASRKYNIPNPTISRWIKAGFIKVHGYAGRKTLIDEIDIAYCAEVYRRKEGGQGKWLLARNGTPYNPKGRK